MLPHIRGRPVTMERYHRGIGAPGFFQKDVSKGFPEWLERVGGSEEGRYRASSAGLRHAIAAVAGQPEQHHAARLDFACAEPYQPDICVFDLDPSEERPDVLRAAALALRDLLEELGLRAGSRRPARRDSTSWCRSTAGRFRRRRGIRHAYRCASGKRDPDALTQEFSKADRGGRILVDTGRNGYSATFAAAYAVRARRRARIGAVHLGGTGAWRGRTPDVHAANDGLADRRSWRPVAGYGRNKGQRCGSAAERLNVI